MKKVIVILSLCFLLASVAYAGTTRGNCGCGLGSMIFEGENGLVSQSAAYTTNGTFGNQSFGITFGTLGCDKAEGLAGNEKLDRFVSENMDNLATDIAAGQGETLETLAEIIEIPAEKRAACFASLQENFDAIYPSVRVGHDHVVAKIADIVGKI